MALTISNIENTGLLSNRAVLFNLAFDSSYPTGGEALTPNNLGMEQIVMLIIQCQGGYSFEYDISNQKVKAYWVDTTVDGAPQAEVANTTDLSGVTGVQCLAIGV